MSQSALPHASVLVVDDTIENLRLLSSVLGEQGYDVRAVPSGRQALQSVDHDPPDLILLDISMPEMDGYEVCRQLRAKEGSRMVPVIFLTALTETSDKVRAFETGAVDYITKPFQLDEVLARVRTHVALRRAQAALTESYGRLRQLEQLRDDLVHMIVHDMRSPLTALLIRLRILTGRRSSLDDALREDLLEAVQSAEDVSRMANDLLDVSRLEGGKMPLERASWDLTRIAGDVRTALATLDPERFIEIDSAEPMEVSCDGALVRRTIENLVSNGIRHTPPGTPVRISLVREGSRVRVAVHDEGPGVPAEAREKIFEKFGTIETRRDRTYHSAGLGLAFCKLAVDAHGGSIGVEPRLPAGSTFWFELPVVKD